MIKTAKCTGKESISCMKKKRLFLFLKVYSREMSDLKLKSIFD